MNKKQLFSFNSILVLCFILFISCEKDKEDLDPTINSTLPAGIEFSMHVDDKEWAARSVSYVSFLVESESMGNNYVVNVGAYSTDTESRSEQGDDPNQESIHFSFSIPASEIKNAVGTYSIGEVVDNETVTSYTGLAHYVGKNHQKYMPNYNLNQRAGSVTITKAAFGDQGMIGELPLGDGLKSIEGTFEFGLYLTDNPEKNLNVTKGTFKLKTGDW